MTLLGKIFTVCILLASFFLMVVAMFVFASHRNWQTAYADLDTQLQAEQASKQELESRYTNQVSKLEAEKEAHQQDVRKLESAREQLTTENVNIQKEIDQLQQERRANAELVKSTEENNNRLTEEVATLRASIRENQQARDAAFATTLKATSDLHTAAGQLQTTTERNEQLVDELAHVTRKVTDSGLSLEGEVVPRVRGVVSATRRADGGQLIEITVGADDGVKPGQTVEIFRGERYLGRAEILKADPDRAVARVLREFQQGQIQEGDDVATKLRVG